MSEHPVKWLGNGWYVVMRRDDGELEAVAGPFAISTMAEAALAARLGIPQTSVPPAWRGKGYVNR